ncbi:MAG: hypothetical protein Kow0069_28160 [Promethearchaeota archaeon]
MSWIVSNTVEGQGVLITNKRTAPYPEVTGYTVPTLYQWGEKDLARQYVRWLVSIQNKDGSIPGPDGRPYTFDTGQVLRGFTAAWGDVPGIEGPTRKACDWILSQVQSDGSMNTPTTDLWGKDADDRIHLYVLPPLREAGRLLGDPKYEEAVERVLEHYKKRDDLVSFNTLNHFVCYVLEALHDLGERKLVVRGLEQILKFQTGRGSVPAYPHVRWVCSTGLAQLAVVCYKLGLRTRADLALNYLLKIQNRSGGFFGSYGTGSSYFPDEEISWAAKYFLDALYWKVRTAFNFEAGLFSEIIDPADGRAREVASFFNDLRNGRLLDAGCGKGRFLRILAEHLPNAQLHGLDISEQMLNSCPPNAKLKLGTLLDIRYPDGYFDGVLVVEALEHAIRVEKAVKELARVLKRGGKILIIDKNVDKMGALELEEWEQWFDPKRVLEFMLSVGIETSYEFIPHGTQVQPDGLFVAWKGEKKVG